MTLIDNMKWDECTPTFFCTQGTKAGWNKHLQTEWHSLTWHSLLVKFMFDRFSVTLLLTFFKWKIYFELIFLSKLEEINWNLSFFLSFVVNHKFWKKEKKNTTKHMAFTQNILWFYFKMDFQKSNPSIIFNPIISKLKILQIIFHVRSILL